MPDTTLADTILERLNDGEIGALLEREFQGKRGHLNPRKDSDFLLEFQDEASVPSMDRIQAVLATAVKEWGYGVTFEEGSSPETLCVTIFRKDTGDFRVLLVISTRYPHGNRHNYARVTCSAS